MTVAILPWTVHDIFSTITVQMLLELKKVYIGYNKKSVFYLRIYISTYVCASCCTEV